MQYSSLFKFFKPAVCFCFVGAMSVSEMPGHLKEELDLLKDDEADEMVQRETYFNVRLTLAVYEN
jgi:hypothetical protein